MSDEDFTIDLNQDELQAIGFAASVVKGVEDSFADSRQVGTKEGNATSDVLKAIVSRAVLSRPTPQHPTS